MKSPVSLCFDVANGPCGTFHFTKGGCKFREGSAGCTCKMNFSSPEKFNALIDSAKPGIPTKGVVQVLSFLLGTFTKLTDRLTKLLRPSEEDLKKYQFFHMKNSLSFLPYGAAVDEFQTEVYDHPEMTPEQRLELWRSLEKRYLPWRKYKHEGFLSQGRAWQRQTHIYKWPFYYIDYVLAQVCALQYHFMDEENHENAWNSYLRLLRCSGFQSFDETLALAGLESPFAPGVVAQVGKKAMEFLEKNG